MEGTLLKDLYICAHMPTHTHTCSTGAARLNRKLSHKNHPSKDAFSPLSLLLGNKELTTGYSL